MIAQWLGLKIGAFCSGDLSSAPSYRKLWYMYYTIRCCLFWTDSEKGAFYKLFNAMLEDFWIPLSPAEHLHTITLVPWHNTKANTLPYLFVVHNLWTGPKPSCKVLRLERITAQWKWFNCNMISLKFDLPVRANDRIAHYGVIPLFLKVGTGLGAFIIIINNSLIQCYILWQWMKWLRKTCWSQIEIGLELSMVGGTP
jgi:hypothetical protein